MPRLEVKNLSRSFGKLTVVDKISFQIFSGQVTCLLGPSGCGKSTVLNIIGGLLKGDSGSIKINADPPMKYGTKSPNQVIEVRRKGVGWIFQDFHLLDHITSLENVILSLELAGMSSEVAEQRAISAMERVDLSERMRFMPNELSGGQQQRVAVARAIAGSRPLLLADEPTGNLDVKAGESVIELFKELCSDPDDPISVLMVTHDPLLASKADRMLLMRDGVTASSDIRSAWGEDAGVES
ncbi:MAG TPA: ABC transporter ATP-binding protein [Candidatus Poseidoniales archaeon]|nr:MAG TPA: ABC transporter ATP-binding protein [Candidatus Poseidoniales archaeon]